MFLAGGGKSEKVDYIVAYLNEAINRGKLDPKRKALLVTDYIVTGGSITPILHALKKIGIECEVAAISSIKDEEYLNNYLDVKVALGGGKNEPSIYSKQRMSGIIKSPREVISRSIKKEIPSQSESARLFQKRMNDVRADAFVVADSVFDFYEKRIEDDNNFSSESQNSRP